MISFIKNIYTKWKDLYAVDDIINQFDHIIESIDNSHTMRDFAVCKYRINRYEKKWTGHRLGDILFEKLITYYKRRLGRQIYHIELYAKKTKKKI